MAIQEEGGLRERELLCLPMGKLFYGVSLEHIVETAHGVQITPMPCLPPCFCGVCNQKGTIVPILRLNRLAGLPDAAADGRMVTVIVKGGEYLCGFLLEEKPVVLRVSEDRQIQGEDAAAGGACKVRAIYDTGEGIVMELDLEATLEELVAFP